MISPQTSFRSETKKLVTVNVNNGDFHLLPGSGAIDIAFIINFPLDIDGDIRPVGSGPTPYDVGADEQLPLVYLPLVLK